MSQEKITQEADILDEAPQVVKADLRKFNKAEDQTNKAVAACSTITLASLKTPKDVENAMDLLKKAKQVETIIENKRKDLVKPFNEAVKRINDYAKELTGKIIPAINTGKKVLLDYNAIQEKNRLEERTKVRTKQLQDLGFIAENGSFVKDGIMISNIIIGSLEDGPYGAELQRINQQLEEKKKAALVALEKQKEANDFFGEDEETALIDEQVDLIKSAPAAPVHIPSFGGGSKTKGLTKTWTFDITDLNQVPREYLVLDEVKVRAAIKDGTRSIAGLNIYQKESISLR